MPRIKWDPVFSVNVKVIDAQHKSLISFINRVYDQIDHKDPVEAFSSFYKDLATHAVTHFNTEEGYFKQFNFELTDIHIAEHNRIKAKVLELSDKFDKSPSLNMVFETLEFLDTWLFNHLMEYDKKYVKCFNSHGLY